MALVLTVLSGPREGAVLRAAAPGVVGIGRGPSNELHVVDVTMSRLHAAVTRRGDGWWVDDKESRNGVWIGGARVRRHRLSDGDVVRFGKITEVRFTLEGKTREGHAREGEKFEGNGSGAPAAAAPAGPDDVAPLDPEHLVGAVVGGYRVEEPLPPCGPGRRFRARDEAVGRDVALRVFGFPDTASPEFAAAFEREVHIASRLVHPNVVPVLDRGEDRGVAFAVEDCVAGIALSDLLTERRFVTPTDAAKVALHMTSGLVYLVGEAAGVAHLSAASVLVNDAYDTRLVRLADPSVAAPHLPAGDAGLVAPELALGREVVDEIALVYCVGALLYRMLCGIAPHDGATIDEAATRAMRTLPTPVRRINLKVSPVLERVVHDALDRDPGGRIPTLSELREMLRRAM